MQDILQIPKIVILTYDMKKVKLKHTLYFVFNCILEKKWAVAMFIHTINKGTH